MEARLFDVFPADLAHMLRPAIQELLRSPQSGLFGLSLAITLFTCASTLESFRSACNHAFGTRPRHPWWLSQLQSVGIVIVGAGSLLGLALLLSAGLVVEAWLRGDADAVIVATSGWGGLKPFILAVAAFGALALLFRLFPGTRSAWSHVLLGSGVVVAFWSGGGACVSLYISAVSTVNPIYAALGGAIGVMVFFYLFAVAMVLGIELVAELEARASARCKEYR